MLRAYGPGNPLPGNRRIRTNQRLDFHPRRCSASRLPAHEEAPVRLNPGASGESLVVASGHVTGTIPLSQGTHHESYNGTR